MSRVDVDESGLERHIRKQLEPRARRALALYTRERLKLDAPDYPFRRHPGERSVRSPASQSVRNIPGGLRIAVEARGAVYSEFGNDQGGEFIKPRTAPALFLPLKGGGGARRGKGKGRVVVRNGRAFLVLQKVRTYEGRHLLEKSVRRAFGLTPGVAARNRR